MTSVKIVVAGAFGVGKTTFVGTVSEIRPLMTEAAVSSAGANMDHLGRVPGKTTTTVAMDFGRVTLESDLVLYLFGAPGQHRFWFMWDYVVQGAVGAVVLVDTRRLADAFSAVDYFERSKIPFVVGVNGFNGIFPYHPEEVREALTIRPHVPIMRCDARIRSSVTSTLIKVVEQAMAARELAAPPRSDVVLGARMPRYGR